MLEPNTLGEKQSQMDDSLDTMSPTDLILSRRLADLLPEFVTHQDMAMEMAQALRIVFQPQSSELVKENSKKQLLEKFKAVPELRDVTVGDILTLFTLLPDNTRGFSSAKQSSNFLEKSTPKQQALGSFLSTLTVDELTLFFTNIDSQKRVVQRILKGNELQDYLRERAGIDPLTGLLNRKGLMDWILNRMQSRNVAKGDAHKRKVETTHKNKLLLMQIDIDHFKQVNDKYGHPVGDETLGILADVLREIFRDGPDAIVRYGGEEFWILIEVDDVASARKIAQRGLDQLNTQFGFRVNLTTVVEEFKTGSIGAQLSDWGEELENLTYLASEIHTGTNQPTEESLMMLLEIIKKQIIPHAEKLGAGRPGESVSLESLEKKIALLRTAIQQSDQLKSTQVKIQFNYEQLVSDIFIKCFNIFTYEGEQALGHAKVNRKEIRFGESLEEAVPAQDSQTSP